VSSRPKLTLVLLTVLAGVLRFIRLDQPCLWYDESMVFWRTCGSYGQLLDCLRSDGFVPLHYSLIWVITRFARPTPFVLRFVPALTGTLMVPAVYFLARQMLRVSTSLVAAAFAACSAFLLFYSRDAKMYMDAWLFVTLNTACLLWWFRSGKMTAWLCWIASGCAACGLQPGSAIPVGLSVLLLLTQRTVRWQNGLLWVLGLVLILAGPVGYYEKFNTWKDKADEDWEQNSGLHWIGAYNFGRTGPQLVRFLSTSTLMGWEWPKDLDVKHIPPERVEWPADAAEVLLGILILSALPWPRSWRGALTPSTGTPGGSLIAGGGEGELDLGTSLDDQIHPYPDPRSKILPAYRERGLMDPEPQWRTALWLGFLIVIPVYGFYCRSMPGFATPVEWWHGFVDQFHFVLLPLQHHWMLLAVEIIVVAIIVLVAIYNQLQPAAMRAIGLLMVIGTILGICQAIGQIARHLSAAAEAAGKPWESMWVPRYIGFIWPFLAVAAAAMIMRLPTRPVRAIAIALLLGINLAFASFRIFGQSEPPVDRMAVDYLYAQDPSHRTLAWMALQPGMLSPGSGNLFSGPGEYYLDLLGGKSTNPPDFKADVEDQHRQPEYSPTPWHEELPANLDRVILWNQYDIKPLDTTPELPAPPGWRKVSEEQFMARDSWIWQDLWRYKRVVWEKSE